jgi:hypothetical protein|tara:strand:- start:237 stop:560 length:324 start_codon:yes stop_codon:yes gene_type:complete
MTFENLYTGGGEFNLPSGQPYVGPYHVHVSRGAMVGGVHTPRPHDILVPANSAAAERVKSLQNHLRAEAAAERKRNAANGSNPASSQTPPPSQSSSAPSGGGGGGGY